MPRTHISYCYPYSKLSVRIIEGWNVIPTVNEASADIDIRYKRYTANYSNRSARPFRVGKSGFASLKAAVLAVLKNDALRSKP